MRRSCSMSLAALSAFLAAASPAFAGDTIKISLKHDSAPEQQTKIQLERLLASYDLRKYTFTDKVVINEAAIPHSHPILTLHTRHLDSDDELLSTYVHEHCTGTSRNTRSKLNPQRPSCVRSMRRFQWDIPMARKMKRARISI
jgi:hypothetical protein